MDDWPIDAPTLDAEQEHLAAFRPEPWVPAPGAERVAGVFLAFARGRQGPGCRGDRGWVGAALLEEPSHRLVDHAVRPCVAGARYEPGRLALREGPALETAVEVLDATPSVVLVDATGRDHPRRAGLALQLGAHLDLPTVGVTHRPLRARGAWPEDVVGAAAPLRLDGDEVGAWLRTRQGARPVAVHAAWRTDPQAAIDLVRCCMGDARTPEPLRRARVVARVARSRAEHRIP